LIFIPLLFDALDAAEAGLEVAEEAMIDSWRPTFSRDRQTSSGSLGC
tara:strand:- start:36 stop:176 length:141 start_codon:yes stop_codon:yes gene_type:complete